MLKILFAVVSLLAVCSLPVAAQKFNLSVAGGFQHSWIPRQSEQVQIPAVVLHPNAGPEQMYLLDIESTFKEKPAGYVNESLGYSLNERLQLFHSLGVHLMRYQTKIFFRNTNTAAGGQSAFPQAPDEVLDEANSMQNESGKTTLLYLMQEIGVRYNILPRLWAQGSIDVSHLLYSQLQLRMISYNPPGRPGPTNDYVKVDSGSTFKNLVLGAHIGFSYELSEKISLSTSFHHSFTTPYKSDDGSSQETKPNLLRLGVQYKLKSW